MTIKLTPPRLAIVLALCAGVYVLAQQPVRLVDVNANAITIAAPATTNTTAQTVGPQVFYIGSTAAPSAVTTGNSVGAWSDLNGRTHITGDASMSKLLVTPDSVALPANQSVNINQWNAAAVASPDANSYVIGTQAATATSTAAALACNILTTASTNSTNCKNAAGNFYGYELYNTTTTVYYLRMYNLTTAPTCSSATGFIRSVPIAPASASGLVGGSVSNQSVPTNYSTGIGYCITGGSTSTDNTNAAAGIFGEIRYK